MRIEVQVSIMSILQQLATYKLTTYSALISCRCIESSLFVRTLKMRAYHHSRICVSRSCKVLLCNDRSNVERTQSN